MEGLWRMAVLQTFLSPRQKLSISILQSVCMEYLKNFIFILKQFETLEKDTNLFLLPGK